MVPVRLNCRFSNGLHMSYAGRAIGRDNDTLRVLISENFEVGIALTAICSLLDGPTSCRVAAVRRGAQAGFFEAELRLIDVKAKTTSPVPKRAPDSPALRAACGELADRLSLLGPKANLSDAVSGMTAEQSHVCLWAAMTAVLAMCKENGWGNPLALTAPLKTKEVGS